MSREPLRTQPERSYAMQFARSAVKGPIPAELKPSAVVAVVDTREQCPLDLSPLTTVVGTLATGDYSVKGLVDVVAIERKSLSDLLGCIGQSRERFDKEIMRLLGYPCRRDLWWRRRGRTWSGRLAKQGDARGRRGIVSRLDSRGGADHHGRGPCPGRAVRFQVALHRGPAPLAGGPGTGGDGTGRGAGDDVVAVLLRAGKPFSSGSRCHLIPVLLRAGKPRFNGELGSPFPCSSGVGNPRKTLSAEGATPSLARAQEGEPHDPRRGMGQRNLLLLAAGKPPQNRVAGDLALPASGASLHVRRRRSAPRVMLRPFSGRCSVVEKAGVLTPANTHFYTIVH